MSNTTTFETAKVGDRVWSLLKGWGEITEILDNSTYPINVSYGNSGPFSYTYEGYRLETDITRTLFWDEVKIEAPSKPLPDLKVDAKVFVWVNPNEKRRAHFSHFDDNKKIHVFLHGRTSFTTDSSCS